VSPLLHEFQSPYNNETAKECLKVKTIIAKVVGHSKAAVCVLGV
jgi:hypothetical protein